RGRKNAAVFLLPFGQVRWKCDRIPSACALLPSAERRDEMPKCPECERPMAAVLKRQDGQTRTDYVCLVCALPAPSALPGEYHALLDYAEGRFDTGIFDE